MKWFVVLMLSCMTTFAQVPGSALLSGSQPTVSCNTNFITPAFVTNLSTGTDSSTYLTPAFTPSSNALLIAISFWTTASATIGVGNTGTSNLTWWRAVYTNVSTTYMYIHVTQLPPGMSPFSMEVGFTNGSALSFEGHITEIANANQSALWGSNAIVQASFRLSLTGTAREFTFESPACGSNAIISAMAYNASAASGTPQTNWVSAASTSHSSPAGRLETFYHLATSTNVPSQWTTNTTLGGNPWLHVMLEVR
jgi:hypothetical protein